MRNNRLLLAMLIISACGDDHNSVRDIDGNVYRTVSIGDQVWMAENLRATHYRNGDPLLALPDTSLWANSKSGAYCYYDNDSQNISRYGLLYNWHAINDSRNIAPEGWHLPSEEEIMELMNFLGGDTSGAGKLKEAGLSRWLAPNLGATNESGFTALPGGYRLDKGTYHTAASNGYWWSANRSYEMYAWSPRLYTGFADVKRERYYENYGFSVRCIKDRPAK